MTHITRKQYEALVTLVLTSEASGWASKTELKDAKAALATIPYLTASGTAISNEPEPEPTKRFPDFKAEHVPGILRSWCTMITGPEQPLLIPDLQHAASLVDELVQPQRPDLEQRLKRAENSIALIQDIWNSHVAPKTRNA